MEDDEDDNYDGDSNGEYDDYMDNPSRPRKDSEISLESVQEETEDSRDAHLTHSDLGGSPSSSILPSTTTSTSNSYHHLDAIGGLVHHSLELPLYPPSPNPFENRSHHANAFEWTDSFSSSQLPSAVSTPNAAHAALISSSAASNPFAHHPPPLDQSHQAPLSSHLDLAPPP